MTKEVFNNIYSDESLPDVSEDIMDAIIEQDLPKDEHGFTEGSWEVIVNWIPEETE